MFTRGDRLRELFRAELAVVLRGVKDPGLSGFLTVTDLTLSADMKNATVYYSVLGTGRERESTALALERAAPYIRQVLHKRLSLRMIPHFQFVYDETPQKASRIDKLFLDIEKEGGEGEEAMSAGMILFDKPQSWTSHDAAEAFRRMLPRGTKVGHTGTLDPLATGLLILLVGPCTRLQARLQGWDKVYSGLIRLGIATDTGDITGKTIAEKEVPPLTQAALQAVLDGHLGALQMDAPAYSAVKHQGKALYKYARQGIAVPAKPRTSVVHSWKALSYASPDLEHRLSCSSGTYVRSLAESVGKRLGCGATVLTLRRERVGGFAIEEALSLEQAKSLSAQALQELLIGSLPRLEAALKPSPAAA